MGISRWIARAECRIDVPVGDNTSGSRLHRPHRIAVCIRRIGRLPNVLVANGTSRSTFSGASNVKYAIASAHLPKNNGKENSWKHQVARPGVCSPAVGEEQLTPTLMSAAWTASSTNAAQSIYSGMMHKALQHRTRPAIKLIGGNPRDAGRRAACIRREKTRC